MADEKNSTWVLKMLRKNKVPTSRRFDYLESCLTNINDIILYAAEHGHIEKSIAESMHKIMLDYFETLCGMLRDNNTTLTDLGFLEHAWHDKIRKLLQI